MALLPLAGCDDGLDSSEAQQTVASEVAIYPLDLWAQPLPKGFSLSVSRGGEVVSTKTGEDGSVRAPLEKGQLDIVLSAPDFEDLVVTLDFDGERDPVLHRASEGHGATLAKSLSPHGEQDLRLYLGLRHKWFSAEGRPARPGNRLDLFTNGEDAYASVADEIQQSTSEVLVSTWWWESDFELVRPAGLHTYMTEAERKKNTVLAMLEARPAQKRVLVGQLWGQDGVLSSLTVDAGLTAHGAAKNDKFDYLGQANGTRGKFTFEIAPFDFGARVAESAAAGEALVFPEPAQIASTVAPKEVDLTAWPISVDTDHASYHQKFLVIDHEVAFVGGMNLRKVDWDTKDHEVFEPRRMSFGATSEEREAVALGEAQPDNGPRKDYMVRVDGPAAQDVADVFKKRWDRAIADKVKYANNASAFEVEREISPRPDGVTAQITATLPDPIAEHAILESWLNAVAQASEYIFIEDQYFRAPLLNDAIYARMKEVPGLRLVVITKPINEWADPGCVWTYQSAELFADAFPGRFLFLQLRSFATQEVLGFDETDGLFVDMDVHSKMLIVDDRFMSVGSCNKNNRGLIYEGELNIAVLDDAWVGAARRLILSEILPDGAAISDDPAAWFAAVKDAAEINDAVFALWDEEGMDLDLDGDPLPAVYRPRGKLYTLPFADPSECLLESVGEDMTGRAPPSEGDEPDPKDEL